MSGIFDISSHTNGFENDTIYYNNPMAFLAEDNRAELWEQKIILGTTWADICLEQNQRLAGILERKNMQHWLDIRGDEPHDWPIWKQMFPIIYLRFKFDFNNKDATGILTPVTQHANP
ncbi:hypothetical protein [Arachidicoccus ginsenosidivorans]|uniref:hypothetical protein n=1 Tax=Arachidicoccus ginsenosidivorans TaxID=496057 RepID=UPI001863DADD|nr:hypothetical protein [Arachidicoccus ginsenosidivorans]